MELLEAIPSLSSLSDMIGNAISTTLNNTLGRVLYMIVSGLNWFFSIIYRFFEVFSGQIKVTYKGDANFLTNIFFENSTVSGVYWGMAIIGVVLCFTFTIIAVIRKMFDGSDKIQASLGAILGSMFKSLLLILSLNVIMIVVLNFTNVLMQQVLYAFNAGSSLTEEQEIDFTEDQFATMGRVLNTIGNYSLNPSYNSRYNLNSCFNEIRGDLRYLQQQGVFEFYYITKDANGNEVETWQSALQTLVFAADLEEELKMDIYHEGVSNALLNIMETLRTNTAFYPLEHYERDPLPITNLPLDRVLFLACTYNAAWNDEFNVNPSHTDPLRGPYYNGQKSIYDFDQVVEDFNLVWGFNYIVFFLIIYGIWKELMYILLDCVARMYNMVLLYLVGPPFIALSPLDNGGKMKQWMTAFVVQCFGVFGTVIAMRLLLLFAPIVISTDLEIFANPVMDIIAKVILVNGGCLAARKASAVFTGILADSAGFQSITAGSLRSDYDAQKARSAQSKQSGGGGSSKNVDTAKSAAKLYSGTGDVKDAKKVADAINEKQQDKTGGGGPKGKDTGGGPPTDKSIGGGGPTGKDTGGGPPTDKTGGGGPTGKDTGGGPPTDKTGGGGPKGKDTGGGGPTGKDTGVGGPTGKDTGGGNTKKGSGFTGIPVPPPIPKTGFYRQNAANPDANNGDAGAGNGQGVNRNPNANPAVPGQGVNRNPNANPAIPGQGGNNNPNANPVVPDNRDNNVGEADVNPVNGGVNNPDAPGQGGNENLNANNLRQNVPQGEAVPDAHVENDNNHNMQNDEGGNLGNGDNGDNGDNNNPLQENRVEQPPNEGVINPAEPANTGNNGLGNNGGVGNGGRPGAQDTGNNGQPAGHGQANPGQANPNRVNMQGGNGNPPDAQGTGNNGQPNSSGQANPGQVNPSQVNPGQVNPGQVNPGQVNPERVNMPGGNGNPPGAQGTGNGQGGNNNPNANPGVGVNGGRPDAQGTGNNGQPNNGHGQANPGQVNPGRVNVPGANDNLPNMPGADNNAQPINEGANIPNEPAPVGGNDVQQNMQDNNPNVRVDNQGGHIPAEPDNTGANHVQPGAQPAPDQPVGNSGQQGGNMGVGVQNANPNPVQVPNMNDNVQPSKVVPPPRGTGNV